MRRAVLSWVAIGILFVTACAFSVTAVRADLYSPGAFVRSYLDALARGDAESALAMPGVRPGAGQGATADDTLLLTAALGTIDDIRVVDETTTSTGEHTVLAEVSLDSAGTTRTTFHVQPGAAILGLFPTWRFSESPLATLLLAASGDDTLTVNDQPLELSGDAEYFVFAPGSYRLDRETTWLEAADVRVAVTEAGTITGAALDIRANAAFRAAASRFIDAALDECAEQQVLQPTGCPFGRVVTDRVSGEVSWSIAEYPVVTLSPGDHAGEWTATAAQGRAALAVPVQSLFTGDESTLDATVSISAEYDILLAPDNTFTIGAAG